MLQNKYGVKRKNKKVVIKRELFLTLSLLFVTLKKYFLKFNRRKMCQQSLSPEEKTFYALNVVNSRKL